MFYGSLLYDRSTVTVVYIEYMQICIFHDSWFERIVVDNLSPSPFIAFSLFIY